MPYKDRDAVRQYQLEWMWRRRLTWILENGPCRWCGSCDDLSVSFILPWKKVMKVAAIWSRSDEKRAEVLADCEVLCAKCHRKKMAIWHAMRTLIGKERAMQERR